MEMKVDVHCLNCGKLLKTVIVLGSQNVPSIMIVVPSCLDCTEEAVYRRKVQTVNPCQLINNCPINVVKCQEERCPHYKSLQVYTIGRL